MVSSKLNSSELACSIVIIGMSGKFNDESNQVVIESRIIRDCFLSIDIHLTDLRTYGFQSGKINLLLNLFGKRVCFGVQIFFKLFLHLDHKIVSRL